MSGPRHEPTRAMPAVKPTLTTAPAEGPNRWWSSIPHHLGRARTSTVIMALLFLAIGLLYLYVRPATTGVGTAGGSSVTEPAGPVPTTEAPVPTTDPTETAERTETTDPTRGVPEETTPSRPGSDETAPEDPAEPTTTSAPTTGEAPPDGATIPTRGSTRATTQAPTPGSTPTG